MKSNILFLSFGLLILAGTQAQSTRVFYASGGTVTNCPGTCTTGNGNCFTIAVSGVGTLNNTTNGLTRVCFSLDGNRPQDYDIVLIAPDGTTATLVNDAGATGQNYVNGICFTDFGPDGPVASPSFPGTISEGNFTPTSAFSATFNTPGTINANGNWQLCIRDDNSGGTNGTLNNVALTFGPVTAEASPGGSNCASAVNISSLPFFRTNVNVGASGNNYTGCTSNLTGREYIYTYTPTANEHITIRANFNSTANAPTVSLLSGCPGSGGTCIQTDVQGTFDNYAEITAEPLTAGTTYYIILSSQNNTTSLRCDLSILAGTNGSNTCSAATTITTNAPLAGNNINTPLPNLTGAPTVGAGNEMPCNGAQNNFIYYQFTTSNTVSPAVNLGVFDINCGAGASGIQVALFQTNTPCVSGSWGTSIQCQSSVLYTDTYYSWAGLTPNTTYYLVIDGVAGDQCRWNLQLTGDVALGSGPLPVELVDFVSVCQDQQNHIEWTTSSELNNDHFDIEKSEDALHYQQLQRIPGAGNSNNLLHYETWDPQPFATGTYYRLVQTDYDGQQRTYGPIYTGCSGNTNLEATVSLESVKPGVITVYYQSMLGGPADVWLLDMLGRRILAMEVMTNSGLNRLDIPIASLPRGAYVLQAGNNLENARLKFVYPY